MEVTEKARNRSGGLLKAKMKKKVTKKNSQFFVAWKRCCISQLARSNKPKLRLSVVLIHCDIQVYLIVPQRLTHDFWPFRFARIEVHKIQLQGWTMTQRDLTELGSALALPQAPCLNMGKAVLQGVSSQSSPKDVGVDPLLSLEIPFNIKPSCAPLQEGHGACGQGSSRNTREILFSLLPCFVAVKSFTAAQH